MPTAGFVRLPQRTVLAAKTGNARSTTRPFRSRSVCTTISFWYSCSRMTVSSSAVGMLVVVVAHPTNMAATAIMASVFMRFPFGFDGRQGAGPR